MPLRKSTRGSPWACDDASYVAGCFKKAKELVRSYLLRGQQSGAGWENLRSSGSAAAVRLGGDAAQLGKHLTEGR